MVKTESDGWKPLSVYTVLHVLTCERIMQQLCGGGSNGSVQFRFHYVSSNEYNVYSAGKLYVAVCTIESR